MYVFVDYDPLKNTPFSKARALINFPVIRLKYINFLRCVSVLIKFKYNPLSFRRLF